MVLVANEVGSGIVPDHPLGRSFRDLQGLLNQRIAARADRVVLMVAGLPLAAERRVAGNAMSEAADKTEAERHRAKMAKRKAVQDAEVAGKTIEKGLLIVHTGPGKGKSTAAFGLALRMLGRGHRGRRGAVHQGRLAPASATRWHGSATRWSWHTMGEGFTWETQDRAARHRRGRARLGEGARADGGSGFGLVVLDELNIALRYDYLDARRRWSRR